MPDKKQIILVIGPGLESSKEEIKALQKVWDKDSPPLIIIESPDNYEKAIRIATSEVIKSGNQPALFIFGHGGANMNFEHTIGLSDKSWATAHVNTNHVIEDFSKQYYSEYQKSWQKRNPNADPGSIPMADISVESCYSEVVYADIKPAVRSKVNILTSDSTTKVSYASNLEKEILSFNNNNAEIIYLENLVKADNPRTNYNLSSISTPKGVIDGDLQRKLGISLIEDVKGFKETIEAALANIKALPENLRDEATNRINSLKQGNVRNDSEGRLLGLIAYLAEPEKRYTPITEYIDSKRYLETLSTSKDPEKLKFAAEHLDKNFQAYALGYFTTTEGYGRPRKEAIRAILDTKPEVFDQNDLRNKAIDIKQLDILKYFMDHTDFSDFTKEKILTHVVKTGNEDYAKYMYAKQNIPPETSAKVLLEMGKQSNLNAIKFLEPHTNLSSTNDYGSNALHSSIQGDAGPAKKLEVVTYLASKININEPDHSLSTPLHLAALTENLEIFKVLLSKGADVTKLNMSDQNVFDIALSEGNYKIAEYIKQNNLLPKLSIEKTIESFSTDVGIDVKTNYLNIIEGIKLFEKNVRIDAEKGVLIIGDKVFESTLSSEQLKELKSNDVKDLLQKAASSKEPLAYDTLSSIVASAEVQKLPGLEIIQNKGTHDEIKLNGKTYKVTLEENIKSLVRE